MISKKDYDSPEVEIIKFSFENILANGDTDDPEYIRQSNPESAASGGAEVSGDDFE